MVIDGGAEVDEVDDDEAAEDGVDRETNWHHQRQLNRHLNRQLNRQLKQNHHYKTWKDHQNQRRWRHHHYKIRLTQPSNRTNRVFPAAFSIRDDDVLLQGPTLNDDGKGGKTQFGEILNLRGFIMIPYTSLF